MNKTLYPLALIIASAAIVFPAYVYPQSSDNQHGNIVGKITEGSSGNVIVEIDGDLLDKILYNPELPKKIQSSGQKSGYGRANGYRVQVFSDGRNQNSLEARAKARGAAILAKFPKYRGQVYTQSSSPNWYTRIGNFRSATEAQQALEELKRAFPQYSSEMRVVKSKIISAQ